MATTVAVTTDRIELQRALWSVDPAALLAPTRILRRVLREHFQVSGLGLTLPHRRGYAIARDALLQLASPAELGLSPEVAHTLPATVLLLEPPSSDLLALPQSQLLRVYWRRLFHLHIDRALDQAIASGKLTDAVVQQRIDRIGRAVFAEVRAVLAQERILLRPDDERHVYAEFVAVYVGLRTFAPDQLEFFFPLLTDQARIDALVAEDVDAAALLQRTRLPGAADPVCTTAEANHAAEQPGAAPPAPDRQQLLDQARAAGARGNVVRAAILQTRAGADGAAAAETPLDTLCRRLQAALWLNDEETAAWRAALPPLLERAARGFWSLEARLLYDLQKACVEHERTVSTVDLVQWALSLGRRPVRREQPGLRGVRIVRRLRSAERRLPRARLPEAAHEELTHLVHTAVGRAEGQLRTHFRPLLNQALDAVGLVPQNLPERVAREKVVEVLLDHIGERGHFNLSLLRDAISANQLKVDEAFPLGDQLLLLDRHLSVALDGVYRPGEVYLRWLQTLSFGAFGTPMGRFLMRFLVLPFGGAFVLLAGLYFLGEEGPHLMRKAHLLPPLTHEEEEYHKQNPMPWHVYGVGPFTTATLALGVFLFLTLHVPPFRAVVVLVLRRLWRGLRLVLIDGPVWLYRLPLLRALLRSPPVVLFGRFLARPLLVTATAVLIAWALGAGALTLALTGGGVFVVSAVFLRLRLARDLEETLIDGVARAWRFLSVDLVPSVLAFIMWLSRWFLDQVERVLYTVDEWLLFRTGESKLSLAAKAVLGVFWFAITYVVRIYTNLLVEPTVNPIKHFPVVTVGHKLMLPLLGMVIAWVEATLEPLDPVIRWPAWGFAAMTIFFFPGIFGFVAWELRANWRLFRANRAPTLRPVLVGSHGESVPRLLRPGFHSGTLPKLFRKLRRAARHDEIVDVHKREEALHHVEGEVRHFIDRDFLNLLLQSRRWGGKVVALDWIRLGSSGIRFGLGCAELGAAPLVIAFDEERGWLVAGVAQAGWLDALGADQRAALADALAGLYRLAGVNLTREQLAADLPPAKWVYEIAGHRLTVRPGDGQGPRAVYDLTEERTLRPRDADFREVAEPPALDAGRLLLANVPVTWDNWVRVWQADQAGAPTPALTAAEVRLLPHGAGGSDGPPGPRG
jgi:hypothetical protein